MNTTEEQAHGEEAVVLTVPFLWSLFGFHCLSMEICIGRKTPLLAPEHDAAMHTDWKHLTGLGLLRKEFLMIHDPAVTGSIFNELVRRLSR